MSARENVPVDLSAKTCLTKEQRLGSVNAYHGKLTKLVADVEAGDLPVLRRAFQQTETCSLMQAAMRILSIRDAVIVVHGPVGCAASMNSYREIFRNIPKDLGRPDFELHWLTTNLTETDVVHGGETKLKEALLLAEERYSPKAIFVITTCTTGIMGDDVEGAIESLSDELTATVVPIHCESIRSAISQTAFDAIAHATVKYLVKPAREVQKDLVAIPSPYSITWSDRLELNRLLGKLGLRAQYIPDFASVEELEYLSEAAVVAPTCQSYGDYWQVALHEKFGVPYFRHPSPLGVANTSEWLRQVAKFTGKEDLVEAVIAEEIADLTPKLDELKAKFEGKDLSLLVSGGQSRCTFLPVLAHELGIRTTAIQALEIDSAMVEELGKSAETIGDIEVHVSNWQPYELTHMDARLESDLHTACPMMGLFRRKGALVRMHSFRSDFSKAGNQLGFRGVLQYGYILLRAYNNPSLQRQLSGSVALPYKKWWTRQPNMLHYASPEPGAASGGAR